LVKITNNSSLTNKQLTNKNKIINDPVYGFISIEHPIIFDLIGHPYYQRLRNIKQLGLTDLVYPGAVHNRFTHALGATHLMGKAIKALRLKDVNISNEEAEAASIAILLHDIGHGPFSHALEYSLFEGVDHEYLSLAIMKKLNIEFDNRLKLAIDIFTDNYSKHFLHQLVSSQLDVDRLDYLKRDSFYSGVSEGIIGIDRIIKMFDVVDDRLVVEEKGIYSIEKFIVARRLMYWQVYLHKTVLGAEYLLVNILKRAKELAEMGVELFASPVLKLFLYNKLTIESLKGNNDFLNVFMQLDDADIFGAIKVWRQHSDPILSYLCTALIQRQLFRVQLNKKEFLKSDISQIKKNINLEFGTEYNWMDYLWIEGKIRNNAYKHDSDSILLKMKSGELIDLSLASDNLNISALSEPVEKNFICYPKSCGIN
jgi:HD superfamily phosphohydrolase